MSQDNKNNSPKVNTEDLHIEIPDEGQIKEDEQVDHLDIDKRSNKNERMLTMGSQASVQKMHGSPSITSSIFEKKRQSAAVTSNQTLLNTDIGKKKFNLDGMYKTPDYEGIFDSIYKKEIVHTLKPGAAANKYYNKHLIDALDKHRSQEVHIRHLKEFKRDIDKLKSPIPFNSVRFNVDEKNEIRKLKMLKTRINNKNFHNNEKAVQIYQTNSSLQQRIDQIKSNGSRNYDQRNLKTFNYNRTPAGERQGSLNFNKKRREAEKIELENIRIATRIMNQKATMTRKEFDTSYKKSQKTKEMLQSKSRATIDQIVVKQRQKFGHMTAMDNLPAIKNSGQFNLDGTNPDLPQDLFKEGSLTAMMLDPQMHDLRQTWMGAFYLKELKKLSNALKLKQQAEEISQRISEQYQKYKTKGGKSQNIRKMASSASVSPRLQNGSQTEVLDASEHDSETKEQLQKRIEGEIAQIDDPRLLKRVQGLLEIRMKSDQSNDMDISMLTNTMKQLPQSGQTQNLYVNMTPQDSVTPDPNGKQIETQNTLHSIAAINQATPDQSVAQEGQKTPINTDLATDVHIS